jgi:hypothetical protein
VMLLLEGPCREMTGRSLGLSCTESIRQGLRRQRTSGIGHLPRTGLPKAQDLRPRQAFYANVTVGGQRSDPVSGFAPSHGIPQMPMDDRIVLVRISSDRSGEAVMRRFPGGFASVIGTGRSVPVPAPGLCLRALRDVRVGLTLMLTKLGYRNHDTAAAAGLRRN